MLVNQAQWADGGEETLTHFATAWGRLSSDFMDDKARAEYNGLKHGFRARPSGGMIKVGREHEFGVAPPPDEMMLLGSSAHGSSAFVAEAIPPTASRTRAHHVFLRSENVLWSAEATVQKVQLLAMSMKNILSAAKIRNGVPGSTVQFHRFPEAEAYEMPWQRPTGVTHFSMNLGGPGEQVTQITSEQLLDHLREASGLGEDE